jgi:hypothetical protein
MRWLPGGGQRGYCKNGCIELHKGCISSHNLRMPKQAKLTNPYAANQHLFGVAVKSNKVYLPPLGFRAMAGIAALQKNAFCQAL